MDTTPEHLVRDHGPRLRALAARLVGEGAADDVVQRAWVAAWKAKPRRPGAWLERVVRRIAGHVRRGEAALQERERRAARPEAGQDPTAPLERREALEALAAGLAALPSEWAEVVLLRHADGLPPREIAKHLSIPVNTVRSRARLGLAQLREELERRGTEWRPALALLAVQGPREPVAAASIGVLLMSTKTVVAISLSAVAGVFTVALAMFHDTLLPPGAETGMDQARAPGPTIALAGPGGDEVPIDEGRGDALDAFNSRSPVSGRSEASATVPGSQDASDAGVQDAGVQAEPSDGWSSDRWIRVTHIPEHVQEAYTKGRIEARTRNERMAAGMTVREIASLRDEAREAYLRLRQEMTAQRYNAAIVDLYKAQHNAEGRLVGPGTREMPEGQGPLMKTWYPSNDPGVIEVVFLPYEGYREVYEHMWTDRDLTKIVKD